MKHNLLNISEFLASTSIKQIGLFPALNRNIQAIVRTVLWKEFKKRSGHLVEECTSFVFEKILTYTSELKSETEGALVYLFAKRYFQTYLYRESIKCVYVEDLLIHDLEDKSKVDELEDLKIELIEKFKLLVNSTDDVISLKVVSSLVYLIMTEKDYNSQYVSLYVYRKTGLSFDPIYKRLKKLNINITFSRNTNLDKVFSKYEKVQPRTVDDKIITDWERSALFHFENHNEHLRSENYGDRYFKTQQKNKVKSTPSQRREWMLLNVNSKNLEKDYYSKFGMSYRSFCNDKTTITNDVFQSI